MLQLQHLRSCLPLYCSHQNRSLPRPAPLTHQHPKSMCKTYLHVLRNLHHFPPLKTLPLTRSLLVQAAHAYDSLHWRASLAPAPACWVELTSSKQEAEEGGRRAWRPINKTHRCFIPCVIVDCGRETLKTESSSLSNSRSYTIPWPPYRRSSLVYQTKKTVPARYIHASSTG